MPQNWKTYKLEELVTKLGDGLHGTPKYSNDGEYFFINGNNLLNGKIQIKSETKRVNHDQFIKYKKDLTDRSILVSINGTIGSVATYNGENVILGKSACYFNVKEDVDKDFIKHVISSKYFLDYIESNYTGSVIKNVSLKSMREFPISLPPLHEQRAIASILSALDDKIELNLQMNKTLEEMAMALYKHWFVDFLPFKDGEFVESELGMIPEAWEVRTLNEVTEIITDGAHYSPKSVQLGFPMASVKDMFEWGINEKTCRLIDNNEFEKLVKTGCKPKVNDILIAKDGSWLKHSFVVEEESNLAILSSIAIIRLNQSLSPYLLNFRAHHSSFPISLELETLQLLNHPLP